MIDGNYDGFHCYEKDGYFFAEETDEYEQEMKHNRLESVKELSELPFSYQKVHLKDVNPDFYHDKTGITKIFMQIQDYISGFDKKKSEGANLYIWSHICGSGKTMVSCAIANELIDKGYSILFMTPSKLLTSIQSTYHSNTGKTEEEIMKGLQRCDLLILDDLGTENQSQWGDSKIYEVVNDRYLNHAPILFTSNLNIADISNRYNKRAVDRIKQNCIEIHWPEEGTRSAIGKINNIRRAKEYEQLSFAKQA